MRGLNGNVAIVTGALSGIGLAAAERLHADGAQVILTDLAAPADAKVAATLAGFGERARYIRLDVASEDDWRAARADVEAHEQRLDILVHNAGTSSNGFIETIELEAWRKVQAINIDGIFLGTKTFTTLMAASGQSRKGGSSIVVVSSMLGLVGFANASAYTASKGAARLFTKSAAVEFAGRQMPIRVNSGFVATPLTLSGLKEIAEENGMPSAEPLIDELNKTTPMGRMGDSEEVAAAIAFLCSTDSSYITGSELVVDGGYTAR
jgi:NAD(P)-dependent dehydrogenase (short-subunit alcohol dehydrogenase family)